MWQIDPDDPMDAEKFYRRKFEQGQKEGGAAPNFVGLDQGVQGTGQRYDFVISKLRHLLPNSHIVDLGCGTAMFLDYLCQKSFTIESYVGVDMIDDYKRYVDYAGAKNRLPTKFMHKPGAVPFEHDPDLNKYLSQNPRSLLIAIGVTGRMPYHTVRSLITLTMHYMRIVGHGVFTFPMSGDVLLGWPTQAHFALCDVEDAFRSRHANTGAKFEKITEKEGAIVW